MKYKNEVLVNGKGELLEILQEPIKISEEDKDKLFIVPLDGYYEIFNEQRYPQARWDFKLKTWTGTGEQKPDVKPIPSPEERIKNLENMVVGLMDIITGGM